MASKKGISRRTFIKGAAGVGATVIEQHFVQALPTDNPSLSPEYLQVLTEAFSHRPELQEAYLYGSWDAFEGAKIIIKSKWIREAQLRRFKQGELRRLVVCDPARFGDDETVIYAFENTKIVEDKIYGQKDLVFTAGQIAEMVRNHTIDGELDEDGEQYVPLAVVDEDGIGGGVIDNLRSWGFDVIGIKSAAKPRQIGGPADEIRYGNTRAEMWWLVGKMYAEGDIEEGEYLDPILEDQLTVVEYKFKNGRIFVEEKAEIKKRLDGNSPDRADARVMGLYSLCRAPLVQKKRKSRRWVEEREPVSHMAM